MRCGWDRGVGAGELQPMTEARMEINVMAMVTGAGMTDWLRDHGLRVGLIVGAILAAVWVVGWFAKWLQARLSKGGGDESEHKMALLLTNVTRWVLTVTVVLVGFVLILTSFGVHTGPILDRIQDWAMANGIQLAFTLVIAYVALRLTGFVSTRLVAILQRDKSNIESCKRVETLGSVVSLVMRTGILIVAIIMALGAVGVEIAPVIAAAGIIGLAVGFGAQNLVQDVISGFFILLEDQVRVGDVVQLDGRGGLVERITLRTIILRDLAGNVHYVRNGKIDVVTNMTKEYSRYVFDVGVAYRENVDEVIEVLKQIDAELRADPEFKDDILQPIEVLGLDQFADSALIIKARTTTKPIKQWRVGREFNRRLKMKFDELGIEIPFPHLTLYPGQDKKGGSPPLHLRVDGKLSGLAGK